MSDVARYTVDGVEVAFEFDPPPGFRPAAARGIAISRVQEAVQPAVSAAMTVLEQVRKASPDEVEVKFGVKVSGDADWLVAKAATEANFEIKLVWRSADDLQPPEEEAQEPGPEPQPGE
ncbi:CU044_2847 family protein [Actinocorallia longicatena]|uniref:CU044_2847 family protein n=1 Tax=Actinocorallia longicatena TaxID=111803 RepID=A0ABP6QJH2_9ACTN